MGWDRHEPPWNGVVWDRKIYPMDKPAIFPFSAKIGPKSSKNGVFYIFCMTMGGGGAVAPPPPPSYATLSSHVLLFVLL